MADIQEKFETESIVDNIVFETHCNGDKITLTKLALSQEMATSLAWLINHKSGTKLQIEIKLA